MHILLRRGGKCDLHDRISFSEEYDMEATVSFEGPGARGYPEIVSSAKLRFLFGFQPEGLNAHRNVDSSSLHCTSEDITATQSRF